ncbi:radical SAM protein [Acidobacteria bacterium AH-259-L09]|nr:radical SAM protein [Acidobacteria bacterium AH-259-L09]
MSLINISKKFFQPLKRRKLSSLIFFVTSKCNLSCPMCFYMDELNKNEDLSYEEIDQMTAQLPRFERLLLSGGEPFLRTDLAEVVKLFYKRNHVRSLSIPTSGFSKNLIKKTTLKILKDAPELRLSLGFSLDGLEKTHNEHRGSEQSYRRLMDTMADMVQMQNSYPNLRINLNTVITSENITQLPKLMKLTRKLGLENRHSFELIRETPHNQSMRNLRTQDLSNFYREALMRQFPVQVGTKNIQDFLEYIQLMFRYKAQYDYFAFGKKWQDFTCVAGESMCVIDHNGEVRACELRKPLGNLKDHNYDLLKILQSPKGQAERKDIVDNRCSCTHVCFFYESTYWSPKAVFFRMPLLLFETRLLGNKVLDRLFDKSTDSPHGTAPSFHNHSYVQ